MDKAKKTLTEVFGFDRFYEGQEEVVTRLLEGRSVLAIFPTGGGKSLCYQLPALLLPGVTLVISPLIALMKDQTDFLAGRNTAAARLDSSLSREEVLKVYDDLQAGRLKLLYIAPERLNNERFLARLERTPISLLAVDEAHCVSEWGHNFRPDYLKIARMAKELKVGRVLCLTATAPPRVAQDIARSFDIESGDVVNTGFYRPNLHLYLTPCRPERKRDLLLERLKKRPAGPTLVYVTLQKTAEGIAGFLEDNGLPARAYHAGLDDEVRTQVQDEFMASTDRIVAATIAFGMGVDKPDIRYIYHFNLPKSLESYAQEIGRAGRDGKISLCEMLASPEDLVVNENFTYGDTPTPEAIRSLVEDLLGRGEAFAISTYSLSRNHDIRTLVVDTILTYLELMNILRSTGPFYTGYKFVPQKTSAEILAGYDPERARFLTEVFKRAVKKKKWFYLDAGQVSSETGEPRRRIVAALNHLEECGDIELQATGLRKGYALIREPENMDDLIRRLVEIFERLEDQDIARSGRLLDLVRHKGCVTGYMLEYFGEEPRVCGHCDFCLDRPRPALHSPDFPALGREEAAIVKQVKNEAHEALASPRQMARFFCGLPSPAVSRDKLRGHEHFGRFDKTPFKDVLSFIEKNA